MGYIVSLVGLIIVLTFSLPGDILNKKEPTNITTKPVIDYSATMLLSQIYGKNMENFTEYSLEVELSAYTAREEECDSTPEVTASGAPTRFGVVAPSQDIFTDTSINFGSKVLVFNEKEECLGLFYVDDRMSKYRRKNTKKPVLNYRRVDILHANLKAARKFGVQKGRIVWVN